MLGTGATTTARWAGTSCGQPTRCGVGGGLAAPVAKRTGAPLPVVVGVDDSDAAARAVAEAFDIAPRCTRS